MAFRVLFLAACSCLALPLEQTKALAQTLPMAAAESLPAAAPLPFLPSDTKIVTRVDEVNLTFSVTNQKGKFVRDLDPAALNILDNGEPPAKITYFQKRTDLPLRVALVIDTSASVSYRFAFEQKAAQAFFKKILRPKDDSAMVIGFNQQVTMLQPATHDASKLSRGLRGLKSGGETALYDAIAYASDQLRAISDSDPVRRVIVLVTDGEENRSRIDLDAAIEHALRAEAAIYVVNTRDFIISDEDRAGEKVVKRLAESTGGIVLSGSNESEISDAFRRIQDELRSQYAIGYKPRNLIGGLLFRPIRIFGPKGILIHCRPGYYSR